ncbi:MAG: N-acetylmuramoyl-L-alanine amidase, partial [Actinomycetota bacterium]
AGINSISVGIEHAGESAKTPWAHFPSQLATSAKIAAAFCQFIGRAPSREFIIGHVEDARFGGTSTHTDPGPHWPWDDYMAAVQAAYEEEDMTPEEKEILHDAKAFLDALREGLGQKEHPKKPANPAGAGKRVAAATLGAEATP